MSKSTTITLLFRVGIISCIKQYQRWWWTWLHKHQIYHRIEEGETGLEKQMDNLALALHEKKTLWNSDVPAASNFLRFEGGVVSAAAAAAAAAEASWVTASVAAEAALAGADGARGRSAAGGAILRK